MFEFLDSLNRSILVSLNSLSDGKVIGTIVPIFADAPIFFIPLFLLIFWLYYSWKQKDVSQKESLLHIFYASCVAIITSLFIQQFVHLERPETAIENKKNLLLEHIPDASFPSDHASVSVAFLTALYFSGYKKTFWCFLPFVVGMNLSRIIAGVHWPFDILAGIIVGIFSASISFFVLKKIKFVKK